MSESSSNVIRLRGEDIELPLADNTPEALKIFWAANEYFRQVRGRSLLFARGIV